MERDPALISPERIRRLKVQGYCDLSNHEISQLSFGNKFAYIVCSFIFLLGLLTTSIPVISGLAIIAFFGVILPYHPFDYIYNYLLAKRMKKPILPPRSKQLKFACTVATIGLGVTAFLFYTANFIAGYIVGGTLFLVALLVSVTDICIPSMIYNYLFKIKVKE